MSRDLIPLFDPETVAVIGASENPGKLGYHVMKSLTLGGFRGRILPVNPGASRIMGLDAFSSLGKVPDPIDLAIVVVPAQAVPKVFRECHEKGVKGIVLITAGFKEIDDPEGARLQAALAHDAFQAGIPVIGPNTFGIVNPWRSLNGSFTPEFSLVNKGNVGLVSQSGGISHLLAFLAVREGVGISKIIGLGNRLTVDFADVFPYLMEDPHTGVIALYIEGLDDPRRLLEASRHSRGRKPVVAYKTGSAQSGNQASMSHTGSLAGRKEVYDGALTQGGILCVQSAQELLDMAKALGALPLLQGPRVAILTGQAGPGMAACDVCEREGLKVPPFQEATQAIINGFLPALAMRTNPVDMGPAWYNSQAIQGIVRAVMEDPQVEGILLLMMFASANREAVPRLAEFFLGAAATKPVITCLMAPDGIWTAPILALEQAGSIVNYPTPERAAKAMAGLWRYQKILRRSSGGPLN